MNRPVGETGQRGEVSSEKAADERHGTKVMRNNETLSLILLMQPSISELSFFF
jgi:hypothetical protein